MTIPPNEPFRIKSFRVRVGHNQVDVEGADHDEAIRRARKKLSDDMPRLYDVITTLDTTRFQVVERT